MTDSKTVVEDLAVWLTAVWDEEERLAIKAGGDRWVLDGGIHHESHPNDEVVDWVYDEADEHIAYHDPASVLARIAADRKILALHAIDVRKVDHPPFDELTGERWADQYDVTCAVCGWAAEDRTSACETVRLLAFPYADRPGFRPEWLVERQGVER